MHLYVRKINKRFPGKRYPADASKLYIKLQIMREKSDYSCIYVTAADEMQPLFDPAREFISKVGSLIKE